MMSNYYSDRLSAERLKVCYQLAPPRVQQYLTAETDFVLDQLRKGDEVLELGCGYGRVLAPLADHCGCGYGIDLSISSLQMAASELGACSDVHLACMSAGQLAWRKRSFDAVIAIQNGLSAFSTDPARVVAESLRVLKPGGIALFSTYSQRFWSERLNWFRLQSEAGLLGEIDEKRTEDGVIVTTDGFRAVTFNSEQLASLARDILVDYKIEEVDQSSLFLTIRAKP